MNEEQSLSHFRLGCPGPKARHTQWIENDSLTSTGIKPSTESSAVNPVKRTADYAKWAYSTGRTESMQPLDHPTRWDLLSLHCRDTERTKNFPSTAEPSMAEGQERSLRMKRQMPTLPHYSVMCWMVWQQQFAKKTKTKQKASRSERIQTFSAQDNMDQYTENSNTLWEKRQQE